MQHTMHTCKHTHKHTCTHTHKHTHAHTHTPGAKWFCGLVHPAVNLIGFAQMRLSRLLLSAAAERGINEYLTFTLTFQTVATKTKHKVASNKIIHNTSQQQK